MDTSTQGSEKSCETAEPGPGLSSGGHKSANSKSISSSKRREKGMSNL